VVPSAFRDSSVRVTFMTFVGCEVVRLIHLWMP
jgi:hypothetical protein